MHTHIDAAACVWQQGEGDPPIQKKVLSKFGFLTPETADLMGCMSPALMRYETHSPVQWWGGPSLASLVQAYVIRQQLHFSLSYTMDTDTNPGVSAIMVLQAYGLLQRCTTHADDKRISLACMYVSISFKSSYIFI